MQRLIPSLLLGGLCLLAACAAPAPSTGDDDGPAFSPIASNTDDPQYGPGDTCAETYVLLYDNARTNFSLGSSNYQNEDFCGAYPYLRWLVDNEPLFTGEEPDDRNFLRLASTYEFFASKADSTMAAERKAYLDSALATRAAGRRAMDDAGIEYDPTARDLVDGFFFYANVATYADAEQQQFEVFDRAFQAAPDSLDDWYLLQLFELSSLTIETAEARADYLLALASAADALETRIYLEGTAAYLVRPPTDSGLEVVPDAPVQALLDALEAGAIRGDDVLTLLAVALREPERLLELGADPGAVVSDLVRSDEVVARISSAGVLHALSLRAFSEGDTARGGQLSDRALANAESDAQRARFIAQRAQRGYGDVPVLVASCIRYDANNAYCRFTQEGFVGAEARRVAGLTLQGRAAYWCMADRYRAVAAISTNRDITRIARETATGYERAAPTREQYFFSTDWRPGDTVTASLGSYGRCSTRVR